MKNEATLTELAIVLGSVLASVAVLAWLNMKSSGNIFKVVTLIGVVILLFVGGAVLREMVGKVL